MTHLVFIVSRPPYQGAHDLELLEAAMVGAVFDMQVSVLFRAQGMFCLLPDQDAGPLGMRTLSKFLQALPAYEVDRLYVCSEALTDPAWRGMQPCVPVKALSPTEQATLINSADAVIGASP